MTPEDAVLVRRSKPQVWTSIDGVTVRGRLVATRAAGLESSIEVPEGFRIIVPSRYVQLVGDGPEAETRSRLIPMDKDEPDLVIDDIGYTHKNGPDPFDDPYVMQAANLRHRGSQR